MFFILLCCSDLEDDAQKHIAELYKSLMPKLVKYSSTKLIDKNCAEDVIQAAFMILIKKYNGLSHENLEYWMFKVTDHLIKNQNRMKKIEESIISIIDIDNLKDEDLFYFENTSYVKDTLLKELSKTESDYFDTYFVSCASHEEAAKKYNISINASKARKCRIKTRIARILKENNITAQGCSLEINR